jgi:hypothetical protein
LSREYVVLGIKSQEPRAGKASGLPVYKISGGRVRDHVRINNDGIASTNPILALDTCIEPTY